MKATVMPKKPVDTYTPEATFAFYANSGFEALPAAWIPPARLHPDWGLYRVWCFYYGKFHAHGAPAELGAPDSGGHPNAHCWIDDSPYKLRGYYPFEVGPAGTLPEPRTKIKTYYANRSDQQSGFLRQQAGKYARQNVPRRVDAFQKPGDINTSQH